MSNDATVWADVVQLGHRAAKFFKLPGRKRLRFEPMPKRKGISMDGDCDPATGILRLRLQQKNRINRPLSRSTIMASLAHELSHLKEPEHGAACGELTRRIATWLKEQGQPVSHRLHVASGPRPAIRPKYKKAWKDPRPR